MKHNFSAGPSILPQSVFAEASGAVTNFAGSGLSILEISHRSPEFTAVMEEATALAHELLNVGDQWKVLFLTGGASSQFFMSTMNLLGEGDKACFVDTGAWSAKAIKESKKLGNTEVVASSSDKNYTYIPKDFNVPSDARYLHITSNNTIFGTQYQELPDIGIPLVADMSSDIMSKPIDMSRFGLIYAGAQKNLGPAGVTFVAVREDFIADHKDLPTMLDYRTHIGKGSMFNTPPVFPIYVAMLNMHWLKAQGGTPVMQVRNAAKADLIYNEIDRNSMFRGVVAKEDRSHMNATFTLINDSNSKAFLDMCTRANIVGIKGHRSVGGFRASMYNAMDISSVQALVDVMQDFENAYAS